MEKIVNQSLQKIKLTLNEYINLGDRFQLFLLLFVLVIFLHSTNFFQNFSKVMLLSEEKRIKNVYGYCSDTGVGYLNHLKKKYKFSSNPKFLHNSNVPRLNWVFYDLSKKDIESKEIIIVNYPGAKFKKSFEQLNKSQFKVMGRIYNAKKIIGVEFFGNFKNLENYNASFDVKFKEKQKNEPDKFNIDIKNKETNYFPINIDMIKSYYIKNLQLHFLSNPEFVKRITGINIYFENQIDVNNYQIIDNFENCYYLKKND